MYESFKVIHLFLFLHLAFRTPIWLLQKKKMNPMLSIGLLQSKLSFEFCTLCFLVNSIVVCLDCCDLRRVDK